MVKHGMSGTRLYQIWLDMRQRCNNPNNAFYHRYGGRGITITPEWETFQKFHEWAVNSGYDDTLTIDRIDNDGNYDPKNCKWSTQKEQAQNKTHMKNRYGHKGIRVSRTNGKTYGYKAVTWFNGKEVYLGYAKTIEEAALIQERGERELHPCR